jgi:hypothetical protein
MILLGSITRIECYLQKLSRNKGILRCKKYLLDIEKEER